MKIKSAAEAKQKRLNYLRCEKILNQLHINSIDKEIKSIKKKLKDKR